MTTKPINILIFGYYFRQNFGDDLFKYVFENYIFTSTSFGGVTPKLIFKNIEDLDNDIDIYNSIDKVIIGGGDLINNFFLNDTNVNSFRTYFGQENTSPTPIYFVSIGLTYPGLISVMDIGDYFYMRNNTDYNFACSIYNKRYCSVIPDIGFNLLNDPLLLNYTQPSKTSFSTLKIGICLPYTWVAIQTNENVFLNQICDFIETLASNTNYEITFLPFDTSLDPNNSDIILNNTIKSLIGNGVNNNIFYLNPTQNSDESYQNINVQDMISYFKSFDIVFASRFHSVILSIMTNTPFISIYSTPKIYNLMNDIKINYPNLKQSFVKLQLDEDNVPKSIDNTTILSAFQYTLQNYNIITTDLNNLCKDILIQVNNGNNDIVSLINKSNYDNYNIFRQSPPQYITVQEISDLLHYTVIKVLSRLFPNLSLHIIDSVLNGNTIGSILPRTTDYSNYQTIITEEILFSITGDPYAPYYYGLYNNILGNNCINQIKWIINDYYKNYYYRTIDTCNIKIINKNFQTLHRSGWQYVVDNIIMELNNLKTTTPLIVDTFIDKTFNWNSTFYENKQIIPYITPWIGFVHHTYSSYNNDYNCQTLFQSQEFLDSLPNCKCLLVLSDYLRVQIEQSLALTSYHVPVINLIHPTENPEVVFNWDLFIANENKQLIQVGNWMRNVFGIYRVDLPKTSIIKQKSILENNNSSNYFPPPNFLNTLKSQLHTDQDSSSIDICRNAFSNMHIKGLYDTIVDMENSVQIISYLNNSDYDTLLSQNIVFLNLVDASAINTLIECITRCTPIIINRLPAVVELLGSNYPLYYNTYYDVSKILDNQDTIYQGYLYLRDLDKSGYDIDTFTTNITNIITNIDNNLPPI